MNPGQAGEPTARGGGDGRRLTVEPRRKRPVGSLPPSKPPTGPAPPRRTVCAPRGPSSSYRRPHREGYDHVAQELLPVPDCNFSTATDPPEPERFATVRRTAGRSLGAQLQPGGELPGQRGPPSR